MTQATNLVYGNIESIKENDEDEYKFAFKLALQNKPLIFRTENERFELYGLMLDYYTKGIGYSGHTNLIQPLLDSGRDKQQIMIKVLLGAIEFNNLQMIRDCLKEKIYIVNKIAQYLGEYCSKEAISSVLSSVDDKTHMFDVLINAVKEALCYKNANPILILRENFPKFAKKYVYNVIEAKWDEMLDYFLSEYTYDETEINKMASLGIEHENLYAIKRALDLGATNVPLVWELKARNIDLEARKNKLVQHIKNQNYEEARSILSEYPFLDSDVLLEATSNSEFFRWYVDSIDWERISKENRRILSKPTIDKCVDSELIDELIYLLRNTGTYDSFVLKKICEKNDVYFLRRVTSELKPKKTICDNIYGEIVVQVIETKNVEIAKLFKELDAKFYPELVTITIQNDDQPMFDYLVSIIDLNEKGSEHNMIRILQFALNQKQNRHYLDYLWTLSRFSKYYEKNKTTFY